MFRNVRYAARSLRRSPLFTAVAVFSLAAGIGANTAVFSFVRAIVLQQLNVPGADRLVVLRQQNEMFHIENCCFSYKVFREIRREDSDFEDVLAVAEREVKLTDRGETERLRAELVSGNYFRMLGVRAAAGRLIGDSDDGAEGASPICVIGYKLWQERYGGRADAVGRQVLIDNKPFQIVGVSQRGFGGASLHDPRDLEIPASMIQVFDGNDSRDTYGWAELIARLKPGVAAERARVRVDLIGRRIEKQLGFSFSDRDTLLLRDGSQGVDSKKEQFAKPVLVLFLLVAVVLLIACANLAALLMVRSAGSLREAGVRVALGATRASLVGRFLTESLLLAGMGGAAGWALAMALTAALSRLLGTSNQGLTGGVHPDLALFAFSAALTLASGILFGLLPAWRASQAKPIEAMQRATAHGAGKASLASRALIAVQVALSLALLFGAGLFRQTLRNLRSIDLGFRPENLVLMHVDLSGTPRAAAAGPFFDDLLDRANAMNGTRAASLAGISLLSGSMASIILKIPGYAPPNHLLPVTYFMRVSNGYFRTLGIPLLGGRDFDAGDRGSSNAGDRGSSDAAIIVNRQFERQFLGGSALGKSFAYGGGRRVHVVGIAGDAKFRWLREETQPVMYLPAGQGAYPQSLYLQVRTAADTRAAAERLRSMVRDIDRRVPVDSVQTMAMQIDEALVRERLLAFLSSMMGILAVTLAAIGLYGVLAFTVVRRTHEIGIRMAVGAGRGRIVRLFLVESGWIAGAGVAAGIPLVLGCGRLASSLLYGLAGQDLRILLGSTALLLAAAAAAAVIPAWRAARLDPLAALRHD
jgi:predicted permease